MSEQLDAAKRVIVAFDRLLDGDNNKSWAEWENGNGESVGREIESALAAYRACTKQQVPA